MSLIQKTSLILITVTLLLASILFMAARLIVVSGFRDLENRKAIENNQRAMNTLNDEINNISEKVLDWAYWTDTYDFMIDRNQEYLDNNVYPISTFSNININLCLFINENGELINGFNTSLKEPREIPLPKDISRMIEEKHKVLNHKKTSDKSSGFLLIDGKAMILVSYPVLTSNEEGPVRGTLAFGRFIDSTLTHELKKETQLNVDLKIIDSNNSKNDIIDQLKNKNEPLIETSNDSISTFSLLHDLNGNPIILYKISSDRFIHKKEKEVQRYFILSIAIFSILFIVIVISLLYILVLKRVFNIQKILGEIRDSGDLSKQIEEDGSDELSALIKDINNVNSNIKILQEELIKRSRETGIAQITSDILQNAGDLLNRVMLASKRVKIFIKNDEINDLIRSIDMLLANREDPVGFFTEGKGELLLEYLNKISTNFADHKRNAELYQKSLERGLYELEELFETYLPYTEKKHLNRVFPITEALDEAVDSQYYGLNKEIKLTKNYLYTGDIKCDKSVLTEILTNLLKNAAEATRDNKEYRIEISSEKIDDNKIRISVTDNGIGIPEDQKIMIFNYRYSTKDDSRGIGLFNSANYAVELNGRLYISESSADGTTMVLELPAEASETSR